MYFSTSEIGVSSTENLLRHAVFCSSSLNLNFYWSHLKLAAHHARCDGLRSRTKNMNVKTVYILQQSLRESGFYFCLI